MPSEVKSFSGTPQIAPRVPEETYVSSSAYGRGGIVGRGRGVGVTLGDGCTVAVGVADTLAVAVAIAVAVGVGLPPPAKLNFPMRVCQLKLPFTAWYSFTCQKLVPSEGSIAFLL